MTLSEFGEQLGKFTQPAMLVEKILKMNVRFNKITNHREQLACLTGRVLSAVIKYKI